MWKVLYTKRAQEDAIKFKKCGLGEKARSLIEVVSRNPYGILPPFEKLFGIKDVYSCRINIRHRLVYEVRKQEKVVLVRMMFKHYGD
ncbi:MAG: Txe/YoeB family addiction module toxin [Puniceicoccales bacterium]|jgi:Txe/YoeB family toxin of toxin-antitoxin system|nr:Txe/YoeB family addiction module toxin [Puniceicoccales bacterium]